MFNLLIAGVLLSCISIVNSYETGAPIDACEHMTPQHHTDPQKTPFPYTITTSKDKINPGDSVEVTITGKKNLKFKGFLVQARVGNQPIGKFKARGSHFKLIDCAGGSQNSATHISPTEKSSLKLIWTAPPNLKETVVFYATVAKNGGEFWVAQKSRPVKVVV